MSRPRIGIIIGSTRPGRFADHPAAWIAGLAAKRPEIELETLDLRDYPMPFFNEVGGPAYVKAEDAVARRWQEKIASLDGFIVLAAEYNRGPTGVLKNALDYAYNEWNKKAVAFVGYGGVGGARAVEQLRLHAIELQMAPIRAGVHILWPDMVAVREGKALAELAHIEKTGSDMLDQLIWWTKALAAARHADIEEAEIRAA